MCSRFQIFLKVVILHLISVVIESMWNLYLCHCQLNILLLLLLKNAVKYCYDRQLA